MKSGTADAATLRILAAIRAVPAGQVAGYGHIARRAGLPGRARLVARVLGVSTDTTLPWHRVVRSDGVIAIPRGTPGHDEQVRRLRSEGVTVTNGRVRMPRSADGDALDAALWGPTPRR
ncbi:MGMT family protein [Luteimonas deserti]|uniref:MGMT family protein n=1 Tax=Luteimonas deserti TaxID=2752306 RepID=A0A7Z0QPY4_9GAMM|nr:MGMT family protein [Luteimonas deserti]NYZ62667.1 MGMT family protein [Luteimonas deserti]